MQVIRKLLLEYAYILNFICISSFFRLTLLDAAEIVESLVKLLVDRIFDAKENIDGNFVASLRNEHLVMMICNHAKKLL